MSGLEFLGAFASAIQLAEFGIKITTVLLETLERLQSYPAQLECHICQVKQLLETTRLIERNRGLQTDIVHSHLNSTLVVAADLQTALEQFAIDYLHKSVRRRFWKIALKGALQEKQIALRFERLEREKSALIFCVTVVHADALANIQGGVELLVDVIAQGMGCEMSSSSHSKKKKAREASKSHQKAQYGLPNEMNEGILVTTQGQNTHESKPNGLGIPPTRADTDKPEQNREGNDTANFGTNETSSSNVGAKAKDELHGNTTTDSARCMVGVYGFAPGSEHKSSKITKNNAGGNSKLVAAVVYDRQMAVAMINKILG